MSTPIEAPLSPEDRRQIRRLIQGTDPLLAERYERTEREREQGLDVARTMLLSSHVEAFATEFRKMMETHTGLGERMAAALLADANARMKEQENVERRFLSLWGPKGTAIAMITLIVTNAATVVGTLWATGAAK